MTELEKKTAEKVANKLALTIHEFNQLNKEQLEYVDLLFKKLFVEQDLEKILSKTESKK